MGPRHTTGVPSSTMKPMDMTLRPQPSSGSIRLALRHARLTGDAQQTRLRGAIDVGIDDADLETQRLQAQCEIYRGRRLADPALARSDGDDVLNAGDTFDLAARVAPGCLGSA